MKKVVGLILLVLALGRIAHVATDGFILSYIYAPLPPGEEIELAEEISAQPYTYLGSGSQSFAFVSQDEKYVLKFFRENRWKSRIFSNREKRIEGRRATYASLREAQAHLKSETALVALHLHTTKTLPTITIFDKNHIAHKIDLNSVAFAIQKKAEPMESYLKRASFEQGKTAIDDVFSLMQRRFAHGLRDKDPHPINNFGVIDGKVIDIDIGGFARDPSKGDHYFYNEELEMARKKLLTWVLRHAPLLESHTNQTITTLQNTH